jgi:hypothetical protein
MYLRIIEGHKTYIIGQKDGKLYQQEINEMNAASVEPLVPLLKMNRAFAEDFLKAVADYSSSVGIKTENENLLKGKLQATEKHLEDLRTHFSKVLDKAISK